MQVSILERVRALLQIGVARAVPREATAGEVGTSGWSTGLL
jgi:hypothetical protein